MADEIEKQKWVEWPRVAFPKGYEHTYEMTDKNGKTWDKAIVSFPQGTFINGVDVTGFALDVFVTDKMKEQIINGKGITVKFDPEKPVEIFKGKDGERESFKIKNPWDICKAVSNAKEEYKMVMAEERAAEKAVEPETESRAAEMIASMNEQYGPSQGAAETPAR